MGGSGGGRGGDAPGYELGREGRDARSRRVAHLQAMTPRRARPLATCTGVPRS